jgi:hypothetical protein
MIRSQTPWHIFNGATRRCLAIVPLAHGRDDLPKVVAFAGEAVLGAGWVVLIGGALEDAVVDEVVEPLSLGVAGDPQPGPKSAKRFTPKKASWAMRRLHHSPTTSRHWATEQCMSSKLVRCTTTNILGCITKRKSQFRLRRRRPP